VKAAELKKHLNKSTAFSCARDPFCKCFALKIWGLIYTGKYGNLNSETMQLSGPGGFAT